MSPVDWMKPIMKTILLLFVPAIIAGLPAVTLAQAPIDAEMAQIEAEKKEASKLFKEAAELLDGGHYAEACPKLLESRRLNPKPGTLYVLAECEFALDRTLTAKTHYYEFLAMVRALPEDQQKNYDKRVDDSTQRLIEMERSIPRIRFVIPPNWDPDTIVRVDGIIFSFGALQNSHQIDPGDHVVATQLKGGPVREERYTVKKGEEWVLLLRVDPAPKPKPLPAPIVVNESFKPEPDDGIFPTSAIVFGAAGGVGIFLGTVFLLQDDEDKTTPGTISMVLGAACLIAGALIVVDRAYSKPRAPAQAWIRPELYASPQGASFGLRGAF